MLLGRMNSHEAINVANSQQKTYDAVLLPCSITITYVLHLRVESHIIFKILFALQII